MNPTLSVIVPIYNVEIYLPQCIESILNQSYTDFELILVDDGSPDKCGEICDDYALRDNRIIVIHKKNGGLSNARNVAIDIARGKYLSFVDSDDFISIDYYQQNMMYLISHRETDIIIMQVCYFDGYRNIVKKNKEREYSNHHDAVGFLLSVDYISSAWINIYKREIFDDIRYPEGQIFEDGYILPDIAKKVTNIYISNIGIYYYRVRENSIMNSKRTEQNWQNILICHFRILDYCFQYPDNNRVFLERYKGYSLALIHALIEYPKSNFLYYINKYQSYNFSFYEVISINANIKEKFKLLLLKKIGYKKMADIYIKFKLYK